MSWALSIVGNVEFLPSMSDRAYTRWTESGLIINQPLDVMGKYLNLFSQLQDKFDLPSNDL